MSVSTAASERTTPADWVLERAELHQRIAALEHRLDWFKRQRFGEKSERRQIAPPPAQMSLGEGTGAPARHPAAKRTVDTHERRVSTKRADDDGEPALFFDARVPVETIAVPNPEMADLDADAFEVIGEKVTYRLGHSARAAMWCSSTSAR